MLRIVKRGKNAKSAGGDERIRTSDQSFSPDAPLAGECLRPARPRLRISSLLTITTPHSLTDNRFYGDLMGFTSDLAQMPYARHVQPIPYIFRQSPLKS